MILARNRLKSQKEWRKTRATWHMPLCCFPCSLSCSLLLSLSLLLFLFLSPSLLFFIPPSFSEIDFYESFVVIFLSLFVSFTQPSLHFSLFSIYHSISPALPCV